MKRHAFAVLLVLIPLMATGREQGEAYRARLLLSGYLIRSSAACKGPNAKQVIDTATRYGGGGELGDFNRAFPKTAEAWLLEGAAHFNEDVMSKGLRATCAEAIKTAREAP